MRSVSEIPLPYRSVFAPLDVFNAVQAEVLDDVLYTGNHIIVSAPTGSGKTIVLELAIVELLTYLAKISYHVDEETTNLKIIYVAPTRALCKEIFSNWERKLKCVHLKCLLVTGNADNEFTDLSDVEMYHVIVTTPEKWFAMTKSWREHQEIVETIKLVLIDEVHLLDDESRGPTLEALVCRMKSFSDDTTRSDEKFHERALRFVAVSGTIPNIEDLAEWIKKGSRINCKTFKIAESKRPITLERVVYGYPSRSNTFEFDAMLSYKLPEIIQKHDCGKPIMVFCQTRFSIEHTLRALMNRPNICRMSDSEMQVLTLLAAHLQDNKLRSALPHGMAFHHAGLTEHDRCLIEHLFRNRQVKIMLCTSTLAMGVNLPAHLVIIKSTEVFRNGKTEEIQQNLLLQMIGRAGRAQYDVSGKVIILTKDEKTVMYRNIVSATTPIESSLHKQLVTHLNSEIALNTINDYADAMKWMRSTFLYVRAVSNPTYYGLQSRCMKTIEHGLKEMCLANIRKLNEAKLVDVNEYYETVKSTDFGKVMARFFVSLNTMKEFSELSGTGSIATIFNKIVSSSEFAKSFRLRHSEKRVLNDMVKKLLAETSSAISMPSGSVKTLADKVSCLLQATLSQIEITEDELKTDANEMVKLAERLSKCLTECFLAKEFNNPKFISLRSSHLLTKCLQKGAWKFGSAKENNVPIYKMVIEFVSDAEFTIVVEHSNRHQTREGQPMSFIALLVGDTENNLIVHSEDISFHLEKKGLYEKEASILNSGVSLEVDLIDYEHDCDLFARVIPAKGNRVVAKPYCVSIFESDPIQSPRAFSARPSVRTIPKTKILTTTSLALPKSSKSSAVQTKVNDFFKKPLLSKPPLRTGASATQANYNVWQDSSNTTSTSNNVSSSNVPTTVAQNSPFGLQLQESQRLRSRSILYDFDESFASTQSSVTHEIQGRSLEHVYQVEHVPVPEPPTPIASKLLAAKDYADDFVSAKSVFKGAKKALSMSFESCDDDLFQSPFKQKEQCPPKNVVACSKQLPKTRNSLEQSISNILKCKVNAIAFNRKYENEFEMETMNHLEPLLSPATSIASRTGLCDSNALNRKASTGPHVRSRDKKASEKTLCDSTDSIEWSVSRDPAVASHPTDSPMLLRKKTKRNQDFGLSFALGESSEQTHDGDALSFEIDSLHNVLPYDDEWARDFGKVPSRDPSMEFPTEWSNRVEKPRNLELCGANEDESPDTITKRKISMIEELIANRHTLDSKDSKIHLKKPCGKMVQARVKRVPCSSTLFKALNTSWDSSRDNPKYTETDRNQRFIQHNILRLPKETRTDPGNGVDADVNESVLRDWFSD